MKTGFPWEDPDPEKQRLKLAVFLLVCTLLVILIVWVAMTSGDCGISAVCDRPGY